MSAKPGELKARWSHSESDLIFDWGGYGATKPDGALLCGTLCNKRLEEKFPEGGYHYVHSFAEELERRGYDLTTLKFSIRQKPKPTA